MDITYKTTGNKNMDNLLQSIYPVLETYSNVHRGSGFNSMVTTHLFEKAREVIIDYLELERKKYIVVFTTPQRAAKFKDHLKAGSFKILVSSDFGLKLGVCVFAIKRKDLPDKIPFVTGGGTTRLYDKNWIIQANAPDRLEAGTPAIINIIAFAKALQMIKKSGNTIFQSHSSKILSIEDILFNDDLQEFSGRELLYNLRKTLIGKNITVPILHGLKPYIHLDNSASTRTFMPIWNAFAQTLFQPVDIQNEIVEQVKSVCADILNAPLSDYEIIFTSNTTESINLVAESLKNEINTEIEPVILLTLLEHSSNDLPWRTVPGYSVERIPVDGKGFWNLNQLEKLLDDYNQKCIYGKKRIKIVAVCGASNVLGTCNNLDETSRIVHQYGAKILVDGAQLIAHRKMDISKNQIDFLAFSAHKVYAPFGIGVLITKKGILKFVPEKLSFIKSSGEENAAGIAALGKSLLLLKRIGFDVIEDEEHALIRIALNELKKIPKISIPGINDPDSPEIAHRIGVIIFGFNDIMAGKIAKKLALQAGIGIRYGCHCAHLIVKNLSGFTPFLEQFQRIIVLLVPPLKLQGFARVSFGIENTESDVEIFVQELKTMIESIHSKGKVANDKSDEKLKMKLKKAQIGTKELINEISYKLYSSNS